MVQASRYLFASLFVLITNVRNHRNLWNQPFNFRTGQLPTFKTFQFRLAFSSERSDFEHRLYRSNLGSIITCLTCLIVIVFLFQSETCRLLIPDLDLEMGCHVFGGKFTTVEGLLTNVQEQIDQVSHKYVYIA